MNLIERLGGYGKAKQKYSERPFDLAWSDIGKALLEYRRENNIFENGDKVILFDGDGDGEGANKVFKIFSLDLDNAVAHLSADYVNSDGINVHHGISGQWLENMKHATDKEIAQGYRDE